MIHYYTNRELSEKLGINLARWKRWSRSFLPPDPLGGMQSGYTRQYSFKDLFKVYLGGHLLSHLKLSLPDSQQVLVDLSPWLNKNGFFGLNGIHGAGTQKRARSDLHRIYFCPLPAADASRGSGFAYLIRRMVSIESNASLNGILFFETFTESFIHSDTTDGSLFLRNPYVRLLNLSALTGLLTEMLLRQNGD